MLPTHSLYVGQPLKFQDSASIGTLLKVFPEVNSYKVNTRIYYQCVSPQMAQFTHMWPVMTEHQKKIVQSNHMWPVKAELHRKSQVNTKKPQVQTSKSKKAHQAPVKVEFQVLCVYLV